MPVVIVVTNIVAYIFYSPVYKIYNSRDTVAVVRLYKILDINLSLYSNSHGLHTQILLLQLWCNQ